MTFVDSEMSRKKTDEERKSAAPPQLTSHIVIWPDVDSVPIMPANAHVVAPVDCVGSCVQLLPCRWYEAKVLWPL